MSDVDVEVVLMFFVIAQGMIPVEFLMRDPGFRQFCHRAWVGLALFALASVAIWLAPHKVFRFLLLGAFFPPVFEAFDHKVQRFMNP